MACHPWSETEDMKREKEPNVWWIAIKLIILAAIIIGGTGMILKYAASKQGPVELPPPSDGGWGIANDSPIRK